MTVANRARLGLARCNDKARRAQDRAAAATTSGVRLDWLELAIAYQTSADEWEAILDEADEPHEMGCDECGAAPDTACTDLCECGACDGQRFADDAADAYADSLSD